MNNKVNYTLVGFFVLIAFVLIGSFIYWLLQPSSAVEMKKYAIQFDESVLGLSVDADVKYRGINVGKVKSLTINPSNIEQVEVVIEILKSTPVKEDTVAQLTSQGITGLSYINLSMGSKSAPFIKLQDGQIYPVIKTVPSFFEHFEDSFDSVSSKLSTTLTQTHKLLNNQNQEQISIVLKKSASILNKIDAMLDEKTINHFQSSVKNIDNITKKLDSLTPKVDKLVDTSMDWEKNISASFQSIQSSYLGIRSSMDEIKRAVASGEFNLKAIAGDVTPQINDSLSDLQKLLIGLDELLEKYERSPGDIIFKQEDSKKGPGEE